MRRIAIIGFHALAIAIGLWIAFRTTLASRFALLQTDPGDTLLNHYILEHTWKCVSDSTYVGSLWSPPCFYPQAGTLAYSENLLGVAPIYWAYRIAFAELTAFQLWLLTVTGLTYAGMAWTLRRFGVSHLLAALGALVFAFGLPRVNQLCHQQLLPALFSPPAVYFAWRMVESPTVGVFAALLALVILQLLASIYLGWFLVLGLAIFFGVGLVCDRQSRERWFRLLKTRWRPVMFVSLAATLTSATFVMPYVQANRGFRRHYAEVAPMIPTAWSWLSPPPSSWWADVLPSVEGPLAHEHHNFPGVVLPALIVLALLPMRSGSKSPKGARVNSQGWSEAQPSATPGSKTNKSDSPNGANESESAAPSGLGLTNETSRGSAPLHPWLLTCAPLRRNRKNIIATVLLTVAVLMLLSLSFAEHSLWRYVHSYVPGAKAIRAVARIFTVVYLFAWIAALIPLDRWLRARGRIGFALGGVLLFIGAAEQYQPRLPAFDPAPFFAEVDRLAVEMQGASAVYVEPERETHFWTSQIAAMWAGMKANVPVVNGYSGRAPKGYPDVRLIMSDAEVVAWTNRGDVRRVGPARLAVYRATEFRPYHADEHAQIITPCPISPTKLSRPPAAERKGR